MAIDVKKILAEYLLNACEKTPLATLTIKQICEQTGVSKQTFYNHFQDKEDLIFYTYETKIITNFDLSNPSVHFREGLFESFQNMKKYPIFMKQACLLQGPNCFSELLSAHCEAFDLKWHQSLYGTKPMSDALRFATIYHANASSSMTLSWILSDMPVSCEEITNMIVEMRSLGMEKLFADGEHPGNPYKD